MSDEPEGDALTGDIEPIKPWTIRAIPTEARDMAIGSARAEGISVGAWLDRRIREWCSDGAAPRPSGTSLAVVRSAPPVTPPATPADAPDQVDRLSRILDAMAKTEDPDIRTAARGAALAALAGLPGGKLRKPKPILAGQGQP